MSTQTETARPEIKDTLPLPEAPFTDAQHEAARQFQSDKLNKRGSNADGTLSKDDILKALDAMGLERDGRSPKYDLMTEAMQRSLEIKTGNEDREAAKYHAVRRVNWVDRNHKQAEGAERNARAAAREIADADTPWNILDRAAWKGEDLYANAAEAKVRSRLDAIITDGLTEYDAALHECIAEIKRVVRSQLRDGARYVESSTGLTHNLAERMELKAWGTVADELESVPSA